MNDQRQVIFAQRLKILKENNINEILKDFLMKTCQFKYCARNFQKSDEKNYLTEIKNISGNVINDTELVKLGKLSENEFNEKFKNLYSEKKNSRIKILGENQNNNLEKKFFYK